MIAKSDIVILLVATTALGISVLRWSAVQPDTSRAITATAVPTNTAPTSSGSPAPSVSLNNPGAPAGNPPIDQTPGSSGTLSPGNPPIDQSPGTNGTLSAGDTGTASGTSTNAGTGNASNATSGQAGPGSGNDTGVHTVVSGDSLGVIANRYNTTVLELQVINGIEGTTIYVGQELRYPLTSN